MDYKEKYEQALVLAKEAYNAIDQNGKHAKQLNTILTSMFPELCETEDERTRKSIIEWLQKLSKDENFRSFAKLDFPKWFDWLERQECPKKFEIEDKRYYYCVKDFYSGGKKQAGKGDVVQAKRGLPIMGLDSNNAYIYFRPVNNL